MRERSTSIQTEKGLGFFYALCLVLFSFTSVHTPRPIQRMYSCFRLFFGFFFFSSVRTKKNGR